MEREIKDSSVIRATRRSVADWIRIIQSNKKGNLSHKEIAEFLHKEHGISPLWAQEVTVLYEKNIGRRVTGQTKDRGFQVGVSKSLPINRKKLWHIIISPMGFSLVVGDVINAENLIGTGRTSETGIEYKLTTYEPYSHLRMRWQLPQWRNYSILQVRISEHKSGIMVLTFHQEKIADEQTRESMRQYWNEVLTKIGNMVKIV